MKSVFSGNLITAMLCMAALCLSSCSYCWPSLNMAEAVLHCDKQVVVCILETPSFKYRYQGIDYYPVKLAYAIDKGGSIYRRGNGGDGVPWCKTDAAERFLVQHESVRTYMCTPTKRDAITGVWTDGLLAEQLIPMRNFPMGKAKRIAVSETLPYEPFMPSYLTYEPVCGAVDGMPVTSLPEEPATWKHVVAFPLGIIDITTSIAMTTTEAAGIMAILPLVAVKNGIEKIFN